MRHDSRSRNSGSTSPDQPAGWIQKEIAGCAFPDSRLAKRFGSLLGMISHGIGDSIPAACQDWANTKAAYRFFSNSRVSEREILGGHFQSTKSRCGCVDGVLLVLHDTSEFSYQRGNKCTLSLLRRSVAGVNSDGSVRHHTLRGILMHSSLVVTPEGLPLGLGAVQFRERKQFKGCDERKRHINPTRVPIEEKESYRWLQNIRHSTELLGRPERCVHIGDRESDIYELFCLAQEMGTRFVIRTCVDRLASNGQTTIAATMKRCPWAGIHTIQGNTQEGQVYSATLRIRYKKVLVQPPIGKEKKYPPHTLTVIHAIEQTKPKDRERIEWKLITNLEVDSLQEAVEKLSWYAKRWKIEVFHKILKSGCKAEESKLRTTERLVNQVAMFCIIGWRVFWMTMVGRESEPMPATCAFTSLEVHLLDQLVKEKRGSPCENEGKDLAAYILKLARLGGYLARAGDPPPGNMVMWRGLSRLNDIQLGFQLATTLVGN